MNKMILSCKYVSINMSFVVSMFIVFTVAPALAKDAIDSPSNPPPSSPPEIVNKKTPHDQPLEAILPINVNTADSKTLMRVPGINQNAARQIVNHRDKNGKYTKLDQLVGFSGIGETTVFLLKKYLVVK